MCNFFLVTKNVSLSRYLDFCVFVKSTDLKIYDASFMMITMLISIATLWKLHLRLFLLNPKYFQNVIWSNTSELYDKFFLYD